ncbi:MAG: hypothetical protein L0Z53_07970, partial [Acidobacteriales bacterium]|nr:hypothetical protein [Terriglobales bacterium]
MLANALRTKLRRLISNQPRLGERLEVHAMNAIGERLYELHFGRPRIASRDLIAKLFAEAAAKESVQRFSLNFLLTEWEELVDAWQLESWEAYRDVKRLGRKTRLQEPQRAALWSVFDSVSTHLKTEGLVTYSDMFNRLAGQLAGRKHPGFDLAVVDEAQDVSVAQLRFLAALGRSYRMLTAMRRSGAAPFRYSTARHLPFGASIARKKSSALSPLG